MLRLHAHALPVWPDDRRVGVFQIESSLDKSAGLPVSSAGTKRVSDPLTSYGIADRARNREFAGVRLGRAFRFSLRQSLSTAYRD